MVPEAGCRTSAWENLASHSGYPFLVYMWGSNSFMVRVPVLDILPSKMLSCSWLGQLLQYIRTRGHLLNARLGRPQVSRVDLSCRKIMMDRDPWRFKDQVPDWKSKSESRRDHPLIACSHCRHHFGLPD